jgi:hypothetical protein
MRESYWILRCAQNDKLFFGTRGWSGESASLGFTV